MRPAQGGSCASPPARTLHIAQARKRVRRASFLASAATPTVTCGERRFAGTCEGAIMRSSSEICRSGGSTRRHPDRNIDQSFVLRHDRADFRTKYQVRSIEFRSYLVLRISSPAAFRQRGADEAENAKALVLCVHTCPRLWLAWYLPDDTLLCAV